MGLAQEQEKAAGPVQEQAPALWAAVSEVSAPGEPALSVSRRASEGSVPVPVEAGKAWRGLETAELGEGMSAEH